jgi:hypothetical protein
MISRLARIGIIWNRLGATLASTITVTSIVANANTATKATDSLTGVISNARSCSNQKVGIIAGTSLESNARRVINRQATHVAAGAVAVASKRTNG